MASNKEGFWEEDYQLFRRAFVERDGDAWTRIYIQYHSLLVAWARQHTAKYGVDESGEDIADQALSRAWLALMPEHFADFPNLPSLLAYIRSCVAAVVIDAARMQTSRMRIAHQLEHLPTTTPEQLVISEAQYGRLWKIVEQVAESEKDRIVLVASFLKGERPRAILANHPEMFSDIREVYSTKRNLLNRMQRNTEIQGVWRSMMYGEEVTADYIVYSKNSINSISPYLPQTPAINVTPASEYHRDIDESEEDLPLKDPYLNTRFDGIASDQFLPVGQRIPLIIWVSNRIETNRSQSSRRFAFAFPNQTARVSFTVRVLADPEIWTVREVEPTLIVAPPGITTQEAEFLIMARKPGADKLYITVEHIETGALVQHIWLPVIVSSPESVLTKPQLLTSNDKRVSEKDLPFPREISNSLFADPEDQNDSLPNYSKQTFIQVDNRTYSRPIVDLPLDNNTFTRHAAHLAIYTGHDPSMFMVAVDATLPRGRIYETYSIPVTVMAIQNATLRLREELKKIVYYRVRNGTKVSYPFADETTITIDNATARQVILSLADAAQQVWQLLFCAPNGPKELAEIATQLRELPYGSTIRILIDNRQFIIPWALLYDKPGPVTIETLDWTGFWGYRYIIDVLPPGRYPNPVIDDTPPAIQLLLNDDKLLRIFTKAQEKFVRRELKGARTHVAWGAGKALNKLLKLQKVALLYCYCHGTHASGAVQTGALAGESALLFSPNNKLRLIDLQRAGVSPFQCQPLVFVNACDSATQYPFFYDGFMPFFIERHGVRGFIGTEVPVPQRFAHEFALAFLDAFARGYPVGEILWKLRKTYLEEHHNILACNYSLYGLEEIRLAHPVNTPRQREAAT